MTEAPLVSCIMPTRDRRAFVPRAIERFLAQDYGSLELVILDDGTDCVRECVPDDPRIRYLRSDRVLSVGAKRNALCREARGEIIAHWDDDDWYPAWRIRRQVDAMHSPEMLASGSSTHYFQEPTSGRAWRYVYLGDPPFVTGATLAYRKSEWEKHPFDDVQVGEDTKFVQAIDRDRVVDLALPSLCISTIHRHNVSPKEPSLPSWLPVGLDRVRAILDAPPLSPSAGRTLTASCIMPTSDRRDFVAIALELFLTQEGVDAELVIVDSGVERIADLCEGIPQVRYVAARRSSTIGAQRNLACSRACGDVIVHWDDDDWYAPDRLRRQIEPIASGRADVTGLENRYTLDLPDGVFWTTTEELHRQMFVGDVHGGTLAYRRSLLDKGIRYLEVNLAEDAALLSQMVRAGARLERVPNAGSFVYVRHGGNAWSFDAGTFLDPEGWARTEAPPAMTPSTVERYRALARNVTAPPRTGRERSRDCLGSTVVFAPEERIELERCVALVASEQYSELLDGALSSLERFGGLAGVPRVVFVEDGGARCQRVARRHDARTIRYMPMRGRSPSIKGTLYSISRFVDAKQYLCLDVDVLVVGSLAPLFEEHARLPPGRVLVAPEATRFSVPTVGDALASVYDSTREEIDALCRVCPAAAPVPHVVNDGVFVADAQALGALDELLRGSSELRAWASARPDVWWRPKGAFNVALAQLGAVAPMDGAYNVQLHVEPVEREFVDGRCVGLWRGSPASILHFNGGGRRRWATWKEAILGAP